MKISFVIPVFNEAQNIDLLYESLYNEVIVPLSLSSYEIVFVNDGSKDQSLTVLRQLSQTDDHVVVIDFVKNAGHQAALLAGYAYSRGDIVACLDADLQHPPAALREMLLLEQRGYEVVYGRKRVRKEGLAKRLVSQWYYVFMGVIGNIEMPANVSDFRVVSGRVRDVIVSCNDTHQYLRGFIPWLGFKSVYYDFECAPRLHGVSGYTWKKMLKLAFDGITNFSSFPLYVSLLFGMTACVTGLVFLMFSVSEHSIYGVKYPLFKWLTLAIYLACGLQSILLWLLGSYVGFVFRSMKNWPSYIVLEDTSDSQ